MHFIKVSFILFIAMALYMALCEAGTQGSKIAGEVAKQAGKAIKSGGPKVGGAVIVGAAVNSTGNININTKPTSRPSSPKNG